MIGAGKWPASGIGAIQIELVLLVLVEDVVVPATGVPAGAGDASGATCAVARRSGEAAASAVAPAASDRTRRRETETVRNELGVI